MKAIQEIIDREFEKLEDKEQLAFMKVIEAFGLSKDDIIYFLLLKQYVIGAELKKMFFLSEEQKVTTDRQTEGLKTLVSVIEQNIDPDSLSKKIEDTVISAINKKITDSVNVYISDLEGAVGEPMLKALAALDEKIDRYHREIQNIKRQMSMRKKGDNKQEGSDKNSKEVVLSTPEENKDKSAGSTLFERAKGVMFGTKD